MTFLKEIKLFITVAEKKSFTAAAEYLMLSTSTVSYQINQMEKELGQKLFLRTTRTMELTDAGKLLYQHFNQILEEERTALESLKNMNEIPSGRLHIKMTMNIGTAILGPLLDRFYHLYPKIELNVELVSRRGVGWEGECDMVITSGLLPDSSLFCRKVSEIRRHLYASPDYLMRAGAVNEPADLLSHNHIGKDYANPEKIWHLTKDDQHINVPVNGTFMSNSVPLMIHMITRGVGIGPIADFLTLDLVKQGLIVPVLPEWSLSSTKIYVFTKSKAIPARCRVLLEFMNSELEKKY